MISFSWILALCGVRDHRAYGTPTQSCQKSLCACKHLGPQWCALRTHRAHNMIIAMCSAQQPNVRDERERKKKQFHWNATWNTLFTSFHTPPSSPSSSRWYTAMYGVREKNEANISAASLSVWACLLTPAQCSIQDTFYSIVTTSTSTSYVRYFVCSLSSFPSTRSHSGCLCLSVSSNK